MKITAIESTLTILLLSGTQINSMSLRNLHNDLGTLHIP